MTPKEDQNASAVLVLLSFPIVLALQGYTIAKLWLWFVAPLGMPGLSLRAAIGLCVLLGVFTYRYSPAEKWTLEESAKRIVGKIGSLVTGLALGWVIYAAGK